MSTHTVRERLVDIPRPPRRVLQLVSLVGFAAVWWLLVNVVGLWGFEFFVGPIETVHGFVAKLLGEPMTQGGELIYVHAAYSTLRVAIGIVLAAVLAIPLGVLIGASRRWDDSLYPALETLRPIPPVAWAPVALIVIPGFVFTGAGIRFDLQPAVLFVVFIGAFFPILTNTVEGVRTVEVEYQRAAESLGASSTQIYRHVVLPAALPSVLTGLSIGVGLGWITLVAAELLIGGPGIGYIIIQAARLQQVEAVVVGMIAVAVLGYGSSALINRIGVTMTPWSNATQER
jgi:NitT/TauT family transport system permease protein